MLLRRGYRLARRLGGAAFTFNRGAHCGAFFLLTGHSVCALNTGMQLANDNPVRSCPHCGAPVIGRVDKVYCSDACKKAAKDRRQYGRGRAKECVCRQCEKTFHPKASNRTSFCSRECSEQHKRDNAKGSLRKVYIPKPKTPRPCVVCGVVFLSHSAHVCSDACTKERASVLARQAANDNHVPPTCTCAECGDTFTPAYGDTRRTYCSPACMRRATRRAGKQVRRARIKATAIEPVYCMRVFARDGWRCMMCGIDTPYAKRGTYAPDAPELDHIVPLALGGPHTYANTQCACRACNQAKGASLQSAA